MDAEKLLGQILNGQFQFEMIKGLCEYAETGVSEEELNSAIESATKMIDDRLQRIGKTDKEIHSL